MSEKQNTSTTLKPNKWLIISLVILALAALGVAGFFAYQNIQLKEKVTLRKGAPTSSLLPTEVSSPTPTVDPTANWLTFTNENICYSFKYPQEITLKERKEENIIHLSLWGKTQKEETEFYDGISLSFSLPLAIGNTSLKDYTDSKIDEAKQHGEILKPREEITINNINGYTYTSQGLGIFQNIFLQSSDKICTVEITNVTIDPTNQGYQKTVDKILSTFKFID